MKKAVIYKITSPSGKVYIGQTWNLKERIKLYRLLCCKGQRKLYSSLKKHGFKNHTIETICDYENISQAELDLEEIKYTNQFKNEGVPLLNLRVGGLGGFHSEETKKLIKSKLTKYCVPITQFSKEGLFIRHWDSQREASEKLNIHRSSIGANLRGKYLYCNNFIFKYKTEEKQIVPPIHPPRRWYGTYIYSQRPVIQSFPNGKFIKEWKNLFEIAEYFGKKPKDRFVILRAIQNNTKSLGFKWKFKE